jgi:tricorn protease-like protein
MTEMSKEGAVGFRQVSAMTFAFCIIGLRDIFGNQSLAMACDDLWAFPERRARPREKIKRKSLLGVVELVD